MSSRAIHPWRCVIRHSEGLCADLYCPLHAAGYQGLDCGDRLLATLYVKGTGVSAEELARISKLLEP